MSNKKAPATALTVTGAMLTTTEAARTLDTFIIALLVVDLKEIDSYGKRTRTTWIDDCRHHTAL